MRKLARRRSEYKNWAENARRAMGNIRGESSSAPLAYSWIGNALQSGHTLAFSLWLSDFKTKTSFGFLIKKSGVIFLNFVERPKNELVQPKRMFLASLAKI